MNRRVEAQVPELISGDNKDHQLEALLLINCLRFYLHHLYKKTLNINKSILNMVIKILVESNKIFHERITNLLDNSIQLLTASTEAKNCAQSAQT